MPDQDHLDPGTNAPEPPPAPRPRRPAVRKRDLAEATGYQAGRTATGLTRLLLRNRTVRAMLRNARDANREED
ncbi:MAG: hypothetical protein J2P43_05085 [Candidatus Dormibacteraeota bacterium]|nr:hypothetical protein [Candidatus Dormibacteraeota bacterium]MBO0744374.1 hypothetical protein [Candidatus Dormibacteraeota bacterium]